MPRILLIDDSLSTQRVVSAVLAKPDYDVTLVQSVHEFANLPRNGENFDLILLDHKLPDGLGLDLLRDWRRTRRFECIPVLMLTGLDTLDSKVDAFDLGAEDYLVKPVAPRELRARVDLRLRQSRTAANERIRRGRLTLHFPLMRAYLDDQGQETQIEFTSKEFRLVALMAQNPGQLFTRQALVNEVWGPGTNVVSRTIDSHICGARRKMGIAGEYIQSIAGSGYRFVVKE